MSALNLIYKNRFGQILELLQVNFEWIMGRKILDANSQVWNQKINFKK